MKQEIKRNYQHYFDLYGSGVFIQMLKKGYKSVCYTNKAIPGPGSPCRNSSDVLDNLEIKKAIFHRNNEVTIFTDNGNLRFF